MDHAIYALKVWGIPTDAGFGRKRAFFAGKKEPSRQDKKEPFLQDKKVPSQ